MPVTAQLGPNSDQVIVIVLDLTGDLSLIGAAKQALIAEISKLPQNAWVGLLRTQDGLHVLADPGATRQMIEAIRSSLNTNEPDILETVHSALSLADDIMRKSPVRASVLYITDGSIYGYREDYTNPVIKRAIRTISAGDFPKRSLMRKSNWWNQQHTGSTPVCGPSQLSARPAEHRLPERPA